MINRAPKTLVVVPAFNEASTVGSVVAELKGLPFETIVLVVDDGSTDGTTAAARAAGAQVARHPINLGVGAAMRTGFRYAETIGAEAVVQVDADGQHDATQIEQLVGALGGLDIVVGSRFLLVGDYQISFARRSAIRFLSRVVSVPCGSRITDATSGFRATGKRGIPLFARYYPTEYLADTVESLALAGRVGLRIGEIPVTMRPRQGGAPSQSLLLLLSHLIRSAFIAFQSLILRLPRDARRLVESQ